MSKFLKVEKFNKVIEKMEGEILMDNSGDNSSSNSGDNSSSNSGGNSSSNSGGNSSNGQDFATESCTITSGDFCPTGFMPSVLCVTPVDNMQLTSYCVIEPQPGVNS